MTHHDSSSSTSPTNHVISANELLHTVDSSSSTSPTYTPTSLCGRLLLARSRRRSVSISNRPIVGNRPVTGNMPILGNRLIIGNMPIIGTDLVWAITYAVCLLRACVSVCSRGRSGSGSGGSGCGGSGSGSSDCGCGCGNCGCGGSCCGGGGCLCVGFMWVGACVRRCLCACVGACVRQCVCGRVACTAHEVCVHSAFYEFRKHSHHYH